MNAIRVIFLLIAAGLLGWGGCTAKPVERTSTRNLQVVIVQQTDTHYRLQAFVDMELLEGNAGHISGSAEKFYYPPVTAAIGEGEVESRIVNTATGEIATSASLSVYDDGGTLFAAYKLQYRTESGALIAEEDTVQIKQYETLQPSASSPDEEYVDGVHAIDTNTIRQAAITEETLSVRTNKAGTVISRGGQPVLSRLEVGGVTSFVYYVAGKVVASEEDVDGDGFYEYLMFPADDITDSEIFILSKSGDVKPLAPGLRRDFLCLLRDNEQHINQFFHGLMEENWSVKKMEERIAAFKSESMDRLAKLKAHQMRHIRETTHE